MASYMKRPVWTLADGLRIVRIFNGANLHWNAALAGGVLNRGFSNKDLDLVFYPHGPVEDINKLYATLEWLGWSRTHTEIDMVKHWRTKGSNDNKHVEVWSTLDGRRVDVIIPSLKVRD